MDEAERLAGVRACVFDAYGTLFDFAAAAQRCRADLGDHADALAETWRTKQLQYTWLRSLMDRYADFWQVTGEALDYALASLGRDDAPLRERLMRLYFELDSYPEVGAVLGRLEEAGMACAILSNGTPAMLEAAVTHAGLTGALQAVYSADSLRIYKPHPSVYQLAVDGLKCQAADIAYLSANAWDAAAAAAYGYQVVWINRFGQARERLPEAPRAEIATLEALPALLGIA